MTDRYALFGRPLGHSKSPLIHSSFAAQTGQEISYELIEAPVDGFADELLHFRDGGGKGANVTMPFKFEALALATRPMPRAAAAGTANCLKFEGGEILGENFDGVGLINDIQRNLSFSIEGKRVLLMGAGGAARGTVLPLHDAGPASVTVVNRTVSKALAIQADFAQTRQMTVAQYGALGEEPFDLVLNATSASMTDELPPIPAQAFGPGCIAYDVVYGKGMTPFLQLAQSAGAAKTADGRGMLVEQAAEAFTWWRGVRPHTADVMEALATA